MSKRRNTGKTDQRGFRYTGTCLVATATQNLKDFRNSHNSSLWTCSHIMDISRNQNKILAFG